MLPVSWDRYRCIACPHTPRCDWINNSGQYDALICKLQFGVAQVWSERRQVGMWATCPSIKTTTQLWTFLPLCMYYISIKNCFPLAHALDILWMYKAECLASSTSHLQILGTNPPFTIQAGIPQLMKLFQIILIIFGPKTQFTPHHSLILSE